MELENANKMSLIGVQWSGLKIHETFLENYYPEMALASKTWESVFATFVVNTPGREDVYFKIVKKIAASHVDHKARYPRKKTPLIIACQFGLDRNRMRVDKERDPFVNREIISLLLERGANPDDVDEEGTSPLHAVAKSGDENGCKALLDNGANSYVYDKNESTPFDNAAFCGNGVNVLKLLVKCRQCENVETFYSSALELIRGLPNRKKEKEILREALENVKRKKESQ